MIRSLATLLLSLFSVCQLTAQLPQGATAPDFTATDLNGQSWHLYELLEAGKPVVLEISATWCPPCWAYHNSHALQNFYAIHGPSGDNTVQVLFVEGDPATNLNCLYGNAGCNSTTPGNWVAGTNYPIINDDVIADLYEVDYFPSIFVICPNKKVYEIGQLNASALWEAAMECPVAKGTNNAGIFQYDKGTPLHEVCGAVALQTHFTLINLGSNPLTSAQIERRWNNQFVDTILWTGYLPTYGEAPIAFDPFSIDDPGTLKSSVLYINNSSDDDPSNNIRNDLFSDASYFNSPQVLLKLRTDAYGAETYWELRDENGQVLDQGGNLNVGPDGGGMFPGGISGGPGAYGNNILIKDTLQLPGPGCYSLHIVDAYGDGMCCNFGNGYYKLYDLDNQVLPLISGGEFRANDDRGFGVDISSGANITATTGPEIHLFPNPADEQVQVEITLPHPGQTSLSLRNSMGQLIWNANTPDTGLQRWLIPTQNLPTGIYVFELRTDSQWLRRKVLVQH
ncbi:MAG: T9SS type A sorting domain-containing protein [Lewinellaceae bacterium]|nr:T9SS type A sorting domain-containing protein [Lewinellaceae bacterium]